MFNNFLIIGIDATNLRRGGGVTHLVELLRSANPTKYGIGKVIVWGSKATLDAIEERPWLEKRNPPWLNKGLLYRSLWQSIYLSKVVRNSNCDLLFAPGGNFIGNFHPIVTMSRNMLPFETSEFLRYKVSFFTLKLLLLRWFQMKTFRRSEGVIFLTKYAYDVILNICGNIKGEIRIIPHGVNTRFMIRPKLQRPIKDYDNINPFRIIYVSTIDYYKHQWNVVKAVASLRGAGFPVVLDLIGAAYPPALKRLDKTIEHYDPNKTWVRYHGLVSFNDLHNYYSISDLGVFASSCENMPNILLETMASGLPIACSNRGPMPEILGDAGVYFDPENPVDIARTLKELIISPDLRSNFAIKSYLKAKQYSWDRCADETFKFLADVAKKNKS